MKNYFFSYNSYGECYTVMAESREEAIDIVYNHIRKRDYGEHYKNKKLLLKAYTIEEYLPGQVIETEYS